MIELPHYPSGRTAADVVERPAASARRRLAAQAIDAGVVLSPVGLLWGSVSWHRVAGPGPDDWQMLSWILAIAAGYLWLLLGWPFVEALSIGLGGRTVGQAIGGVRLVGSFGERVGFATALGRGFMISWSAAAVGTVVLVAVLHWPPMVLLVGFGWTCLATASPRGQGDGWLGEASGTRLVRASGRATYWDQRS